MYSQMSSSSSMMRMLIVRKTPSSRSELPKSKYGSARFCVWPQKLGADCRRAIKTGIASGRGGGAVGRIRGDASASDRHVAPGSCATDRDGESRCGDGVWPCRPGRRKPRRLPANISAEIGSRRPAASVATPESGVKASRCGEKPVGVVSGRTTVGGAGEVAVGRVAYDLRRCRGPWLGPVP